MSGVPSDAGAPKPNRMSGSDSGSMAWRPKKLESWPLAVFVGGDAPAAAAASLVGFEAALAICHDVWTAGANAAKKHEADESGRGEESSYRTPCRVIKVLESSYRTPCRVIKLKDSSYRTPCRVI